MHVEKLMDSMIVELPVVVSKEEDCVGTPFESFKIEVFDPETGELIKAPIPHRLFVSALQLIEAFCGLKQGKPVECTIYGKSRAINIERNTPQDAATPSNDETVVVNE